MLVGGTALVLFAFIIMGNDQLCIIHNITGLPCPGCGMTRAYLALLRGDLAGAFYYHPLFWMVPFGAVVLIFHKYNSWLQKIYLSERFWIVITVIVLVVYVIRMILLFPHSEPMDFNQDALFPTIWRMIFGA